MIEEKPVVEEELQEEEELHWSQKEGADPEAVVEYEELSIRLKRMVAARKHMPRRQVIRMIGLSIMILFNLYILYMSIGNMYSTYTFVYASATIITCLDNLSLSRKMRIIQKGEKLE